MSELPASWITVPIGDVAEVNPRKDVHLSGEELVSFVPMAAVDERSGTIRSPSVRPYGEVSRGYTHFRDEDVIFAKITPSMENGKSAVAKNLVNGTGIGSTEFHVLRSKGVIEPEYLWRFMRQRAFRNNAQAVMSGAVGQQRVPAAYLAQHLIPLAPLEEQRRIIGVLNDFAARVARARNELDQIPELISRFKERWLTEALSGEMTREWRKANQRDAIRRVSLGSVIQDINYGSSAKSAKTGRVPVLRMGNIQDGEIDWTDLAFTSNEDEIAKYRLKPGDVLFNRTNSPELVGKSAMFRGDREAAYAGYLIRIRCSARLMPEFLTYNLNSPAGRAYSWKVKSDGVSQSNINAKKLAEFTFLLPSIEEQAEIVRRTDEKFEWLDSLESDHLAASRLLVELEMAIFAKAFRGELVAQTPGEQSADALLKEVAALRDTQATQARLPKQIASRKKPMVEKRLSVRERLLKDSESWPREGVAYEEVAKRIARPPDEMRDALFDLLAGTSPKLTQRFDKKREQILLQRVRT